MGKILKNEITKNSQNKKVNKTNNTFKRRVVENQK